MKAVSADAIWTSATLAETLGYGAVSCRDALARSVPIPALLHSVEGLSADAQLSWSAVLARVHGLDRAGFMRAWSAALLAPGVPVVCHVREQRAWAWWEREVVTLNLLDVPGVSAVIWVFRDVGAVPTPEAGEAREFSVPGTPVWQLFHLDEVGQVLRCEGFTREIIGVAPHELIGEQTLGDIHPADADLVINTWVELLQNPGSSVSFMSRAIHRVTGEARWYETMMTNCLADPDVRAVLAISYDIEERRAKEQAIISSERQFRTLAEQIPIAVFRLDPLGSVTYANDLFRLTVGAIERIHDLRRAGIDRWWAEVLSQDESVDIVLELGERSVRIRGRSQRSERGADAHAGVVEAVIGSVEDVTADVLRARRLETLAHSDPLTGLANRRLLEQLLDELISAGESFVVLAADLDGFKAVNDANGHHIGDLVLVEIAGRLSQAVRPGDLVARVGGDEFVLVCRDVTDAALGDLVMRVRATVSQPLDVATDSHVSLSIGTSRVDVGDDGARVLQRADVAMYDDKRRIVHGAE